MLGAASCGNLSPPPHEPLAPRKYRYGPGGPDALPAYAGCPRPPGPGLTCPANLSGTILAHVFDHIAEDPGFVETLVDPGPPDLPSSPDLPRSFPPQREDRSLVQRGPRTYQPLATLLQRGILDKSPNRPASPARRLVIETTYTL